MKKNKWIIMVTAITLFCVVSCETEDVSSNQTKAVFSYVADGFLVNFTNFSTNASEYLWEFDDEGSTSTLSNPTHVFPAKGTYIVSLTATREGETSIFTDTVRIIGPNIKIDGDFTDWAHVEFTHENADTSQLLAVKTFASGKDLNFYIEGLSDMRFAVIQIYLDTDNNPATGLASWMYPSGSGADFLFEGSLSADNPLESAGSVFEHVGPDTGWSWNAIGTFGEIMMFSKIVDEEGKNAIEFSIGRDALGSMDKFVNFAVIELDEGYTELGSIPLDQTPDSKFGQLSL